MNTTNSTDLYQEEQEFTVFDLIDIYYIPALVFWGVLGNCISIYVILKTKLKKLSSYCYLVTLLISDTVFLVNLFLSWLTAIVVNIFNRPIMCQIMVYATSVSSCLSSWMVVAFTAERFVAVIYPLKSKLLCTVSRAKIFIAFLVGLVLILYMPQVFIAGVNVEHGFCAINPGWNHVASVMNAVDALITFFGPFVSIIALNTFICKNLWVFSNIRLKISGMHQMEMTERNVHREAKRVKFGKSYNMTKMLLIVSTTCVVLNLPSYIFRTMVYLVQAKILEMDELTLAHWQHYSNIFFNINFGINFLLYCISGQNFRKSVAAAFGRCQRPESSSGSDRTAQSTQSMSISSGKRKRLSRVVECELAV